MIRLLLVLIIAISSIPDYTYVPGDELNYEPVLYNEVSAAVNAYEEYVDSVPGMAENCTFSLIYIDEDEIPELVVYGCCEADGTTICCYYNGEVHEKHLSRLGYTYIEKENLICNGAGHMDVYYDHVYKIEDGEFVEVGMGDYGGNRYIGTYYKWNDVSVSEEEYYRQLNAVYDDSKAIEPLGYYDCVETAYRNLESYSSALQKLYSTTDSSVLAAVSAFETYFDSQSAKYCQLIYIDDNNIPELFTMSGGEEQSVKLCCYSKGKVVEHELPFYSFLHYIEKENILYITNGKEDIVYTLSDSELTEISADKRTTIDEKGETAWCGCKSVEDAFLRLNLQN